MGSIILYPTDLFESEAVRRQVKAFTEAMGAQLYLLHVVPPAAQHDVSVDPVSADPAAGVAWGGGVYPLRSR